VLSRGKEGKKIYGGRERGIEELVVVGGDIFFIMIAEKGK
jgi:hypothetical protein